MEMLDSLSTIYIEILQNNFHLKRINMQRHRKCVIFKLLRFTIFLMAMVLFVKL